MTGYWRVPRPKLYFGVAVLLILSALIGALGFDILDERELAAIPNQPTEAPSGKISIVIKIQERVLEVYSDDQVYKKYRIAVGKSETPTPIGEWRVVWKDYNWGTGFGTRWMGLNVPWGIYGIHGTNKPWSIGRFASHGCIRMRNKDVEELFEWVPLGTDVKIIGRKVRVVRALKFKMAGPDVVIVQMKLKDLGYLDARADGIFGPTTEAAVRNFQTDKGLEASGVVDKQTLEMLGI